MHVEHQHACVCIYGRGGQLSLGPVESSGTSMGARFISLSNSMIFRAPHPQPGLENSISALIS